MLARDSKARLEALKSLLLEAELSTQEDLREKLEQKDFVVTQSTISRDLRKLGAVKAIDGEGRTVYRLSDEFEPPASATLPNLVLEILTNGSIVVIRTTTGSASLVARHLDRVAPGTILGTIAGDDTIFVAPTSTSPGALRSTIEAIRNVVGSLA